MSASKKGVCTSHIELHIDFVCSDCNSLLCMECYRTHSTSHRLVKVEDYFEAQKPGLLRERRRVQLLRERVNVLCSKLQKSEEQREEIKRDCLNSLESFDKVKIYMDRWKEEVLGDLEERKEKELQGSGKPGSGVNQRIFKRPIILCRKSDLVSEKIRKLTPIFIAEQESPGEYMYVDDRDLRCSQSSAFNPNNSLTSNQFSKSGQFFFFQCCHRL